MTNIYTLPTEIIFYILSSLSDYDKLSFTSCSKSLRDLVHLLKFRRPIDFELIKDLSYFDRFTAVKYSKSSEFKIPSCIQEIYINSFYFANKREIKAPKVVIEDCDEEIEILKLGKRLEQLNVSYANKDKHRIIDLRHIHCREMIIENIFKANLIVFPEGLEKLRIVHGPCKSCLILPDSLRVLYCEGNITINRMSQNLEVLYCEECMDITDSFGLPQSLQVFKARYLGDNVKSALLSYYKDLELKSLTIPFIAGLEFEYLKTLEELHIRDYSKLKKIPRLPPKLKKFHILCRKCTAPLPELPATLKKFIFDIKIYTFPLLNLPYGLEVLKLNECFTERIEFPESIRKLYLFKYAHRIDFSKLTNLRTLRIKNYDYDLTDLCDGLEKLILERYSEYNRDIILPHTVRKVRLSNSFNREILLPESLEEIIFGDSFNQKVVLPSRVIKVTFGDRFNQEIDLPDSLQEVSFDISFNRPIKKLPSNLKRLRIGKHYKGLLPPLPKTLKELKFL
jgi:hypothetical protein